MYLPYQQKQQFLLPPNLEELLAEDHLARVVNEIGEGLDLKRIEARYTDFGRPAYHPLMLIKILFYGYATGLRSSRKIAKALETDTAFMWLAGMNKPDFRTISDFRKDNLKNLKELFSQIVATLISLDMISVSKIALDSTKIKAVASRESLYDEDSLNRLLAKVDKEIEEILSEAQKIDEKEDRLYGEKRGDELPSKLKNKEERKKKIKEALELLKKNKDKKKINLEEQDSSLIKTHGRIFPGYNAQAVASSEGFLLAEEVVTEESDNYQARPMIKKTVKNTSQRVKEAFLDSGYHSDDTLICLNKEGISGFMPINQNLDKKDKESNQEEKSKYSKENFTYLPQSDSYLCPQGEKLHFERVINQKKKRPARIYRCKKKDCLVREACTQEKRGRLIKRLAHEELLIQMKEKMKTKEARKAYKKRKVMIEPAFSIIKGPLNFDRFSLRGHKKVRGEWSLICSAFNIFKIWKNKQKIQTAGAI